MYAVEVDRSKRLLVISAAGHVTKAEVKAVAQKVREIVKDAVPGMRVLTDLAMVGVDGFKGCAAHCRYHGGVVGKATGFGDPE